jgi:hypothetical protein
MREQLVQLRPARERPRPRRSSRPFLAMRAKKRRSEFHPVINAPLENYGWELTKYRGKGREGEIMGEKEEGLGKSP